MANIDSISKYGKIFMVAYDQGLEHGPVDFNDVNYHPNYIIKLALESNASCITMQYGMAKKYYGRELRKKLPLVLKVNGESNLYSENKANNLIPVIANVDDAKRLGAVGIGFTIYPGQVDEHAAYEQFADLRRDAEKAGLITAIWCYARGPEIKDQHSKDTVAYAIRVASELGADVAKVKYTGDPKSFGWACKMGAGIKVLVSGTDNFPEDYLDEVGKVISSGAEGIAVGRKLWQHKDAHSFGIKLASKIYNH